MDANKWCHRRSFVAKLHPSHWHALSHHRSDDGLDCRNQRKINSVIANTSFPAEFHRLECPVHHWTGFWGQRVCRPAALQIWLLIQSRNKFAKSENQQMASEKHKWSLKVTYPELSSPTLIKVRMRSPHANYIYSKHCKDGCFDPIEDMMFWIAASFFICRAGNYRGLFTLSLILPADDSQAQTNKFSSYYIYYYVITPNRP